VESINFLGKNIAVTSTNPADWSVVSGTVIGADSWAGEVVVRFRGTEDPNCLLAGFEINGAVVGFDLAHVAEHTSATIDRCILRGNRSGCVMHGCDGLISNCLVAGNTDYTVTTVIKAAIDECCGVIKNCTIADNNLTYGIFAKGSACSLRIENCIIYGNQFGQLLVGESTVDVRFSDIQGGPEGVEVLGGSLNWGLGNMDVDPCFIMLGQWDANGTPGDFRDDFWVAGGYHLTTEGWYWNTDARQWDWDEVTSRCIDAGNPGSPLGDEALTLDVDPLNRLGQNLRINMGAYGGTAEASMPPYYWALLADLDNDGTVNFVDVGHYVEYWLEAGNELPADLDRDGTVDLTDYALLGQDYLLQTSWHE
jgi:hypothetical protein